MLPTISILDSLLLFVIMYGAVSTSVPASATAPLKTSNTSSMKNPIYIEIKNIVFSNFVLSSKNTYAAIGTVNKIQYNADTKSTFPIVPIKLTLWVPIPFLYILNGLNPMYCSIDIVFIRIDDIAKYMMYLFLKFPNSVMFKKLKQYSVMLINPSALPIPTNILYFLKNGDATVDITFIPQNVNKIQWALCIFIPFNRFVCFISA